MNNAFKSTGRVLGFLVDVTVTERAFASNELTPAEKKAGFVLLFDGKDKNAHWRHGETGNTASKWTLEDSSMKTVDEYSFLCTKNVAADQFSDFEWHIDWKLAKSSNSGLFIRVVSSTYDDGYEYGILDDQFGGDRNELSKNPADRLASGKMPPIKRSGGIYDLYPTTKDGQIGGQFYDSTAAKPFGQWNHGVVWAEGNHIEHYLNGRKVVVAEIGSVEWNARFKLSKWNSYDVNKWARNPKGSLCMQAHGGGDEGLAWFKNIKVRAFTIGEKLNSPLITPAGGTFATAVTVTLDPAITGATVRYTLDGSDPTSASPIYKDSLKISASAVVKTVTYRDKFQASDVATATFTISGTGIAYHPAYAGARYAFSPKDKSVRIDNASGKAMDMEVVDVTGSVRAGYHSSARNGVLTLASLKPGIYFIKARSHSLTTLDRIYVP